MDQYLYVASYAADDVYVEDFWLGVWWKVVGLLWRTKILSHIKPIHT